MILVLFLLLNTTSSKIFAQYSLNGSATQNNCHCYTLTQAVNNQQGSVWNNNRINLNQSFDFKFNVFLGCTDLQGADGIVFVLQNQSTSIGGNGSGMGYGGISPGVGVTLDTYQNISPDNDPSYDHIAIQLNGNVNHSNAATNIAGPVQISATNINVEDCQWHVLRVVWDAPTHTYTAYFDGVLRLSVVYDFVNSVFSGNPLVFWGFTGATGGLNNLQQFCTSLTPNFHLLNTQSRCQGQDVNFYDSTTSFGPVVKRYWNFGDGSPIDSVDINPVHVFVNGGDYTVVLTVTSIDGCSEVYTQVVHVGSKPIASFTPNNACQDSLVSFIDNSSVVGGSINGWYWDLGNGTTSGLQYPSATYPDPGPRIIKLAVTSLDGCMSDTNVQTIQIYPKAIANFGFTDNVCSGSTVQFHDSSHVQTGSITGWNWTLGDGQTDTVQNPTGTYITPGVRQIILTAISDKGCRSAPVTKSLTVIARPVAKFHPLSFCQSSAVTFIDSSYSADGSAINTWWWDLGNGVITTTQNPSITYNTTGTINIKLVVRSVNGCISDTLFQPVFVNAKPVAGFSYNNACQDSVVNFMDTSRIGNGSISSWFWDLGNGTVSTQPNPSITYSSAGTRIVKLVVTSLAGCTSDTIQHTVQIFPEAIAKFGFTNNVCSGSTVQFHDSSHVSTGGITRWNWTLGDGQTDTIQNPSGTYLTPGVRNIILIATSDKGCQSAPYSLPLTITGKPVAYFTHNSICQSSPTTFTDSSYSLDGSPIIQRWWDLGNGIISTSPNPTTTYNTTGTIIVRLAVSSLGGCLSDTLRDTLTIHAKPSANFIYSSPLCAGIPVVFTDSSSSGINTYSWIFDNGTSTVRNPVQTFTSGSHTTKLVVTNSFGCVSDTTLKTFVINPKPLIGMDFLNSCKNAPVLFTAVDSIGNTVSQWAWTFGDGSFGIGSTVQHTYTKTGNYTIKLVGVSSAGCISDQAQKVINIFGTNASAGNDIIAASGQPIQLNAVGGVSYQWSPAFGLNDPNIANPIAILDRDQTYYLKAFTPQGCATYDTLNIKIYKGPEIYVPNAFSPNNDGHNDVFHAVPIGIVTFHYLKVYNRWGQQIYNSSDYTQGWDGKYKGVDQPIGIYIWMAAGIDFKGNLIVRKGTIMLVR